MGCSHSLVGKLDYFDCLSCNKCVEVCPNGAMAVYQTTPFVQSMQKAVKQGEQIAIEPDVDFTIDCETQYLNLAHLCHKCQKCAEVCPHPNGAPYRDKPVFFKTITLLNNAGEGYFMSVLPNGRNILISKEKGGIRTLEKGSAHWLYETDHITAQFNLDSFELFSIDFKVPCVQEAHFGKAFEMKVLFEAWKSLK